MEDLHCKTALALDQRVLVRKYFKEIRAMVSAMAKASAVARASAMASAKVRPFNCLEYQKADFLTRCPDRLCGYSIFLSIEVHAYPNETHSKRRLFL